MAAAGDKRRVQGPFVTSQNLKSCVISLNVFWFTIRSITLAAAAIPSPWMMSPPSSFFLPQPIRSDASSLLHVAKEEVVACLGKGLY